MEFLCILNVAFLTAAFGQLLLSAVERQRLCFILFLRVRRPARDRPITVLRRLVCELRAVELGVKPI